MKSWVGSSENYVPANVFIPKCLTLSRPITTIFPYTNSLDLNETSSNWASHPDPRCLTLSPYLSDIKSLWKLKQTRNLADVNLFGRLRI